MIDNGNGGWKEGEDYSDTPGEESSPVPAGRDGMREMREYVCNVYTIRRRVIWSGGGDGGRRYRDEKNNERRISEDPEGHDMNESGSRLNR